MDEHAFEEAWAKIEEVAPVPLDPSKVGEVMMIAAEVHPLRDEILRRVGSGERLSIRLMEPDWEAVNRGEDVPIMAQLYLDQAGEFISVCTTSVVSFAANPEELSDEQGDAGFEFELLPDSPEGIDEVTLRRLLEIAVETHPERDRVMANPGMYARPLPENGRLVFYVLDGEEEVVIARIRPEDIATPQEPSPDS